MIDHQLNPGLRHLSLRSLPSTVVVACLLLAAAPVSALQYEPQIAEVTEVVDGDTLWLRFPDDVEDPRIEYEANLMSVDAPGRGEAECEAPAVTSIARRLLLGKRVWVQWDSRDKRTADGRLLVYIAHVNDHSADLNALFIEQGWAWVPRRFASDRKHKYLELEKKARAENRGLWGGACVPRGLGS